MSLKNKLHKDRPWGSFDRFTSNEPTTVKIMRFHPDEAFSLQLHHGRDEYGYALIGNATVRVGETETQVNSGDDFWIPKETKHRITAGPEGFTYLEIWFGEQDENDIERFEDKYGRV